MGQWESSHVHKWEKTKESEYKYSASHHREDVPTKEETAVSNQALLTYLTFLNDALANLKPLAEKASRGAYGKEGPIIVMVANYGQMQFFVNFCCSARARGLDVSQIVLFATDQETYDLATAMNVTVFHDSRVFASIPRGAAIDYHDINYGKIMMSKVYSVHMVNALEFDLLFQDLDINAYLL
jgi:hypothetical protein